MEQEIIRCLPEESCGLLFGKGKMVKTVIPITNDLHSPTQFRMDPTEQVRAFLAMEAEGKDLIAIYHSHPTGPDHPSPQDIREYAYPGTIYIIWFPHRKTWSYNAFTIYEQDYQQQEIDQIEG
jgi:proteasome lid subunit RPN8/RPN11